MLFLEGWPHTGIEWRFAKKEHDDFVWSCCIPGVYNYLAIKYTQLIQCITITIQI